MSRFFWAARCWCLAAVREWVYTKLSSPRLNMLPSYLTPHYCYSTVPSVAQHLEGVCVHWRGNARRAFSILYVESVWGGVGKKNVRACGRRVTIACGCPLARTLPAKKKAPMLRCQSTQCAQCFTQRSAQRNVPNIRIKLCWCQAPGPRASRSSVCCDARSRMCDDPPRRVLQANGLQSIGSTGQFM